MLSLEPHFDVTLLRSNFLLTIWTYKQTDRQLVSTYLWVLISFQICVIEWFCSVPVSEAEHGFCLILSTRSDCVYFIIWFLSYYPRWVGYVIKGFLLCVFWELKHNPESSQGGFFFENFILTRFSLLFLFLTSCLTQTVLCRSTQLPSKIDETHILRWAESPGTARTRRRPARWTRLDLGSADIMGSL